MTQLSELARNFEGTAAKPYIDAILALPIRMEVLPKSHCPDDRLDSFPPEFVLADKWVNEFLIWYPDREFPDDATIFHEVLHAHRQLIQGVPEFLGKGPFEDAIEHLHIIPLEISVFPNSEALWCERVRRDLPGFDADPRFKKANLFSHFLLARRNLRGSAIYGELEALADLNGWLVSFQEMADELIANSDDKIGAVRKLIRFTLGQGVQIPSFREWSWRPEQQQFSLDVV